MCAVVEMTTVFGGEEWRKRERREPAGEQIRGSSTQKKMMGKGRVTEEMGYAVKSQDAATAIS